MKHLWCGTAVHRATTAALALLIAIPASFAQAPPDPNTGMPDTQQAARLSPDQLDDLVAPIALYPDPMLSQVLVASTYPLELVEAQQWLQHNSGLKGQALMDAARQQNWDASIQAMVAFPDVLAKLNQDVQWTTAVGNAFLAQQSDVMAAVQRMRARAQANGRLSSTPQETVTTETQGGQTAITIAPADPQVIYVPTYDPMYIWGPPAWGYYPPLAYSGFGFGFYPGIHIGFLFGGWGGWGWGGWGWGWGPSWFGGGVFINAGFFNHYGFHGALFGGGFSGRATWQHDGSHRLGVAYPNSRLSARYGAASMASRSAMSRSNSFNANRANSAGGWNRFGSGTSSFADRAQGSRGAAMPGSAARFGAGQGSHFGATQQRYSAPAQRSQGYQGSAQRYSAPAQRSSAPAQHYSAPGSGGSRGFSSGGGLHSSGGGGGPRSTGGGGHSSGGHGRR